MYLLTRILHALECVEARLNTQKIDSLMIFEKYGSFLGYSSDVVVYVLFFGRGFVAEFDFRTHQQAHRGFY